jgi:hypothetical protein
MYCHRIWSWKFSTHGQGCLNTIVDCVCFSVHVYTLPQIVTEGNVCNRWVSVMSTLLLVPGLHPDSLSPYWGERGVSQCGSRSFEFRVHLPSMLCALPACHRMFWRPGALLEMLCVRHGAQHVPWQLFQHHQLSLHPWARSGTRTYSGKSITRWNFLNVCFDWLPNYMKADRTLNKAIMSFFWTDTVQDFRTICFLLLYNDYWLHFSLLWQRASNGAHNSMTIGGLSGRWCVRPTGPAPYLYLVSTACYLS